ncbi:hypothetical protein GQ44DRAFT_613797 [Phaeosphaeriaceae sp. PMI808]|nr:hypothetical protein GQ44DRAFT_613797 [Phaeosphaeriaceae sp. PMI808]
MPARNIPGYPSDQVLQRSDPNPYYSPPSPIYTRQPAPYSQGPTYSQGAAIIQTNRARRSSSITQRPQTIAGEPSAGFWVPGMAPGYPSPPQERGPPPSNSAYQSMQNMQYPGYAPPYGSSGMPQSGYYPPANQTSPPYEMGQRPPLSARGSGYGRSNYPAPIITQDSNKYPSARYGQPPTPNEHQLRAPNQPRLLQYGNEEEDEDSTSESSDEDPEYGERMAHEARQREAREARALMPPPKMKTKRDQSLRRPPLPHANTTQVVDRMENNRRRQSIVVPDRSLPRESREPREQRRERDRDPIVSRRASISRPPPPQQTQSAYDTRGGRMVVNNSMRASRRQSYQAYEQRAYQEKAYFDNWNSARAEEEQLRAEKQEKRASRVLVEQDRRMLAEQMRRMPGQFDDEEEEDEQPVRALSRPRRKTDADARKGKERIPESKPKRAENAAEEYINKTRGARDPHADMINKAAKAPRYPSLPSDDSGNTNNEIRIRVDEGSRLQLTGDMDGRTLQLVPTENGMTELVIGNSRGNEIAYHQSERGSVMGSNNRRSIIAGQVRRDAEDVSERSSRSGRSRRDRDEIREARDDRDVRGHVLRRSRTTNYH